MFQDWVTKVSGKWNYSYDYSKSVWIANNKPIIVNCLIHGEFETTPYRHLNNECKYCALNKRKHSLTKLLEKFYTKHYNNYTYCLSSELYDNNKSIINILCNECKHVFPQRINNHLRGQGCPKCVEHSNTRKSLEQFILESNIIHLDKYKYFEYHEAHTEIDIECPIHGIFKQTPNSHLKGHGCSSCNDSKGEKKCISFFKQNNINYIRQHSFDDCKNVYSLRFDFYLLDLNICVEYDGIQHFIYQPIFGSYDNFLELQKRDMIKNQYCLDNNIRLIRISYLDNILEIFLMKESNEK